PGIAPHSVQLLQTAPPPNLDRGWRAPQHPDHPRGLLLPIHRQSQEVLRTNQPIRPVRLERYLRLLIGLFLPACGQCVALPWYSVAFGVWCQELALFRHHLDELQVDPKVQLNSEYRWRRVPQLIICDANYAILMESRHRNGR